VANQPMADIVSPLVVYIFLYNKHLAIQTINKKERKSVVISKKNHNFVRIILCIKENQQIVLLLLINYYLRLWNK
jgi:hypothetical protein